MLLPFFRRSQISSSSPPMDFTSPASGQIVETRSPDDPARSLRFVVGCSLAAAMILGYVVTSAAWPHLAGPTAYTDLFVGFSTHQAISKDQDYRALYVFLGSATAFTLLLAGMGYRLARCPNARPLDPGILMSYGTLLLLSLLPAAYHLGLGLSSTLPPQFITSCLLMGLVVLTSILLGRFREQLSGRLLLEITGSLCFIAGVGLFNGVGILLILGRFKPELLSAVTADQAENYVFGALLVALLGGVVSFAASRDPQTCLRRLAKLLIGLQAGLPMLYAVLIPAPFLTSDDVLVPGTYRSALPIAIGALAGLSLLDLGRRWRRLSSQESGQGVLRSALSPLCLSTVVLFLAMPLTSIPFLWFDYFHLGEFLLPWQQMQEFGKVPYRDFTPIFGFSLVHHVLDQLFYSGTHASYSETFCLMQGGMKWLSFLAIAAFAGPYTACFVGLLGSAFGHEPNDLRYTLWLPTLICLAHPRVISRPRVWLLVWGIAGPANVLFCVAQGASLVLGTIPVACWMLWRLYRSNKIHLGQMLGLAAVCAGLVLMISPARESLLGLLQYAAGQASSNTVAWGIPWKIGFGLTEPFGIFRNNTNYFLFELVRMAWIPLLLLLGYTAWSESRRPRSQRNVAWMILASTAVLSTLALHGYLLGRIGPGTRDRAGALSLLLLFSLVPMWLLSRRKLEHSMVAGVGVALVFGTLQTLEPNQNLFNQSVTKALHQRDVQRELAELEKKYGPVEELRGHVIGCPRLGTLYATQDQVGFMCRFNSVMDSLLEPDETFLNLSILQALYYYSNRPQPTRFSSFIYAASASAQRRMIQEFRQANAPVVLLQPSGIIDGSPANLRAYRVFREVALTMVPIVRDPVVLLVDPSKAGPDDHVSLDIRIHLLETCAYPEKNLSRLPIAWGQSWDHVEHRFEPVARLDELSLPQNPPTENPTDHEPTPNTDATKNAVEIIYDLSGLNVAGRDADFLLLDYSVNPQATPPDTPPVLSFSYLVVEKERQEYFKNWKTVALCEAHDGRLLVPLGSRPGWLLSPRLGKLRIRLENAATNQPLQVTNARLFRLSDDK